MREFPVGVGGAAPELEDEPEELRRERGAAGRAAAAAESREDADPAGVPRVEEARQGAVAPGRRRAAGVDERAEREEPAPRLGDVGTPPARGADAAEER